MDFSGPQTLGNILQPEELQLVPENIQGKLSAYIEQFTDEYCKERAASNRLSDTEQKNEELNNQMLDAQVKFTSFEQNVTELRSQLNQVSAERDQLLESVKNHDQHAAVLRKEKLAFVDERDSLLKIIERQNGELERLKQDLQTYQQQLRAAISAKCEAIARLDEVQSKEVSLDIKERRLESEHAMLQNEIQLLSTDLNRSNAELQNLRRDHALNTMHLEVRLKEKTDELQIQQGQNAQYTKTIEEQNKKIEELNETMFQHNNGTEKFVDTLKKELDAKDKLIEIYKTGESGTIAERNELLKGISDLKRMLTETTDHYGELEGECQLNKQQHAEEVEALKKTIEALKTEIVHANDLLKEVQEQSLENAICKLAPTAAVASRLMRADMSLTELYSLYAKNSEELEAKNRENAQLKLQIKSIVEEINERAPIFKKQDADYSKLSETHQVLLQQRDELVEKKLALEQELDQSNFDVTRHVKENKKLKQSQVDLSRQVCLLLDELNCLRAGVNRTRNQSQPNNITNSNDAISRDLVTFESISEMQEQNVKLLSLIRELTNELEANELRNDELQLKTYEEKFEKATKRLTEMEESLNQKNNTISTLMAKCERYKKFYFDAQKKLGSQIIDLDDSTILIDESQTELVKSTENAAKLEAEAKLERRIRSLEQQLEDESKKYAALKENYDYYTSEKRKNDALVQEQFDSMRKEVRELTSSNCKLLNANEFQNEQMELLQKAIITYKQQIAALEDRTKNYEKTIVKHEQTVHMLKDEVMMAHRKQVSAETESHSLRHENRVLKDTAARLQAEKDGFHREHQSQALLLNNLEFIKSNLERSETEGRLRLEQRLDDTVRELSAQRRHFQEEEEKFRETLNEYKRQTETAQKLKEEERQQAEKYQQELLAVREELATKVAQVNELSKKLQESLTPSKNENPITAANKKAREFELRYEQAKIEIDSLTNELAKAREHGEQFYKMSQSAETEIKRLHDMHASIVAKLEEEIKKLKSSEAELQTRVTDLEAEVLLSNVTEQGKSTNQTDQLKNSQEELKNVLEKLTESGRHIRTLRAEKSTLSESLNAVEVKYANEMVLHSADIQELTKFKSDFLKVQDELNKLKCGRENLQSAHDELKKANVEAQSLLQREKEESEKRAADLSALNSSLHDQIEALTTKLAALAQSASNSSALMNDSLLEASSSDLNSSSAVDEVKNSEQLLKIIKFLRKEKDLFSAKLDILKAENARLVSEHTILQKKVDGLTGYLNQERSKSETDGVSASKHEAVLRKIETLNAITDSNRILREERNSLTKRVAELTERISSVEKELFPLQFNNKELASKIEELNVENASLRTEAIKWRQRANALVEKSNRNPEEFKRLQSEREHLAKLLTAEKESNKKQIDELAALKARMDSELPALTKALQQQEEARKKQLDEATALKQSIQRQTQDIMELKNRLLQKEEELLKAQEENENKDKVIQDKDSKELMLRKLAKRYKDHYMGLQAQTGSNDTLTELEKVRAELEEANTALRSSKEQHEQLQRELDALKARSNNEQDSGESKQKLEQLLQELTVTKTELNNQEQTLAATKSSYDETVLRLEKDLQENIASNKDVNARLMRENESLHMRINQLQRQLGAQQSTKPTTSSVGITEKGNISESSPRTANVKPMSGSASVQQSATVTPWRGGETPLASIRPIPFQNSRTAAILPTSQQQQQQQQPSAASTSTSTSTSTSSAAATGSSSSSTSSSSAVGNTALVPPQQQVHTTGSATLESMASSSPTSSHTDYMPSTSSAAVAVAAIPPMGSASAAAVAESSQEAESIQHPQQNDAQLFVVGAQQQVVALVSPRVEGSSSSSSSSSSSTSSTQTPSAPSVQDASNYQQQQPSTSGTSSSSSTVVSSHSRHTPSSSNVTTTQAGSSKRPRDVEGDSSTNVEDGIPEKIAKLAKRLRAPMHGGEVSAAHIGDSGMDVDQMPTSSQRDQEDEVQVVDSDEEEEEEEGVLGLIDGGDAEQEEGYEDSYEQDNEMEDNEGAEAPDQHNEVDIEQVQVQPQSDRQLLEEDSTATVSTQENNQQSQAITSGSGESNSLQAPSTSSAAARRNESNSVEIVSSPQVSNFSEQPISVDAVADCTAVAAEAAAAVPADEIAGTSADAVVATSPPQKPNEVAEQSSSSSSSHHQQAEAKDKSDEGQSTSAENASEADEAFSEEAAAGTADDSQLLGNENHNVGTSQSVETDNLDNLAEGPSEDNEGADGVSSEGEKQTIELEEEGREAEATSPSENTRFRTLRSAVPTRRGGRSPMRGNNMHSSGNNANMANRPARIVWQRESQPGSMRGHHGGHIDPNMPSGSPQSNRMFANRSRGRRPMRRPGPNNFNPGGGGGYV